MKNFHGKRDSGGRSFGGGSRGFGGRDSGRPMTMHKAVCSKCGKDCQLPFRPNGNRAVFCSSCFEDQKNENPEKFERSERPERKSYDQTSAKASAWQGKPRFEDKKVFEAVCGNCGDNCLVPFRPIPGKPVFCKKCFSKYGNDRNDRVVSKTFVKPENTSGLNSKTVEQLKAQIEIVNVKLDRVLRMLTPEADRDEEEEVKPVKKVAVKKAVKKKSK